MSETAVQQRCRLTHAQMGGLLWRNNVGVLRNQDGTYVRYGLNNQSKQQNDEVKSSDLIGVTPLLIRPDHVGQIMGIFTAIETKKEGWYWVPSDERAVAQMAFHDLVKGVGGMAGFASDPAHVPLICAR